MLNDTKRFTKLHTLGKWPRLAAAKGSRPPVRAEPFADPSVDKHTASDIIHPAWPRTRYPHETATAFDESISAGVSAAKSDVIKHFSAEGEIW